MFSNEQGASTMHSERTAAGQVEVATEIPDELMDEEDS